jgi:hypothetical protein
MIDQKENPASTGSPTTAQAFGLFAQPEITKHKSPFGDSILGADKQVVSLVLKNNGCILSIDWTQNALAKNRMARWVHPQQNLVIDVFENSEGKIRISMHHLREWQSPQDHLMPRFAKSIAYAISAAGASVRYKQDALAKYEKGGLSDE